MRRYQYDDEYFIAEKGEVFLRFTEYEEEEAFARYLEYGRY